MSQSTKFIEAEMLKLSRSERAQVALHLIDSLEQDQSSSSPEDIEKAWITESVRRLEAYRQGEMKAYPAEDLIAELEKSSE